MTDDCLRRQMRGGWTEDMALERCDFPIGPRNTWSNAAYPLAGLVLYALWSEPQVAAFALCMLFLGIGSGVYHGFKTRASNQLDWAGMYAVFSALLLHALAPGHQLVTLLTVPVAAATAWGYAYKLNGIGLNAQMGLFLGASMIPPLVHGQAPLALAGFGLFLLAYGIWWLDKKHSRIVGLWGHAIWHVLTAAAIALIYASQRLING